MNENWESLLTIAILGTERRPMAFAPGENELIDELKATRGASNESAILQTAALVSVAISAGAGPQPLEITESIPAPAETRPMLSPASVKDLLSLFAGGMNGEILPEYLSKLNEAGLIIPPEYVPYLLDMAARSDLESGIRTACGERAAWLAQFEPRWRFAAQRKVEEDDVAILNVWETGTREARLDLLETIRATTPSKGLELLGKTWTQELHDFKTAALESLEDDLSAEDEQFLSSCLNDKRKEVRLTAIHLLRMLAESKLNKELFERTLPYFSYSSETKTFTVNLPKQLDKELEKLCRYPHYLPEEAKGERQGLLFRLIGSLRTDLWSKFFATTPAQLVEAAERDPEWGPLILAAWVESSNGIEVDPEWARLLLKYSTDKERAWLFGRLSQSEQEALVIDLLQRTKGDFTATVQKMGKMSDEEAIIADLLKLMEFPWSPGFSKFVLANLFRALRESLGAHPKRLFVVVLLTGLYADAELGASLDQYYAADIGAYLDHYPPKRVHEMLDTIAFRRRIFQDLRNQSNFSEDTASDEESNSTNEEEHA